MNILVNYLKKHIESFHEGVCYPCYQCDYKANTSNLKLYVKLVHEGVVHPWDLCDNKCFWYNFQYHFHYHFSWNVWKLYLLNLWWTDQFLCSYFQRMAIVFLSFSPRDFVMKETTNVISPPLKKIISENTFNQCTEKWPTHVMNATTQQPKKVTSETTLNQHTAKPNIHATDVTTHQSIKII